MSMYRCDWCGGPVPARARRDSKFCSKACRQASHRLTRGLAPAATTDHPMRFAYADPPYPGMARKWYRDHPDFAGEVDHRELVERLVDEYPDGWALSTSARAVVGVLRLCPDDVRVGAWFRGPRITRARMPLYSWEPLIVRGGRPWPVDAPSRRIDSFLSDMDEPSLVYVARPRKGENEVAGAKPWPFTWWLFEMLGALPGDTFDDLFAGSGGVAKAWDAYVKRSPAPALFDASTMASADTSTEALDDASPGDDVDTSPGPGATRLGEQLHDASLVDGGGA